MNLASILDPHPAGATAVISAGDAVSYGDLRAQIRAIHGGLASLGVVPGDRVAVITASTWYFGIAHLGALAAGAVVVPLNPTSPTPELQRELNVVRAKVAVVGPSGQAAFSGVDRSAAGIEHVLVPEGVLLASARSIEDLLLSEPRDPVDRAASDLALLIFTSGTAGAPKAAKLTHGNLLANLDQMQRTPGALVSSDVVLVTLPLFHIFGLNAALHLALCAGAASVLVQRFEPSSVVGSIRDRRVSVLAVVPPMLESLLALAESEAGRDDLGSLRIVACGASRLDPVLATQFESRFGHRVGEGYGLTEAAPAVTGATFPSPVFGSIGVALPGVELRLVDDNGEDALVGDAGEIWVRGANVFGGYLDDDEATMRALSADGWLRTGDIAVADSAGQLRIVNRSKDLIIVSGFNVFPGEVEDVLMEHPGIAEAAVVGVPHARSGEAVKAFVVPKPDRSLEEDEVIGFCRDRLSRYKCPVKVQLIRELPHSLTGKVLRRELMGEPTGESMGEP